MKLTLGSCVTRALVAALLMASNLGAQQSGTVTGQVTDARSGQPISAIQLFISELSIGALAQQNGRYVLLNVPVGTHMVTAQRIGFGTLTREVTVRAGDATVVDFQLSEEALGLDEIVVTGTAGQTRRREIGNSVTTLDLSQNVGALTASRTMEDLLQGTVAGVSVEFGSGLIGDGGRIKMRGVTSIEQSNQPLIYIDGVRVRGDSYPQNGPLGQQNYLGGGYSVPSPLEDINPNDIDRIEIIKGPAATTLYGTEAATGVIQIFTKRGTAGPPVVQVSIDTGIALRNTFGSLETYRGTPVTDFDELKSVSGGDIRYAYMDPWMRNGLQQRYHASIRGSADPITYYVSGTFEDDEGLFVTENQKTYNFQANVGFQLASAWSLDVSTKYSQRNLSNLGCGDNLYGLCGNAAYFGIATQPKEDLDYLVHDADFKQKIDRTTLGGTLRFQPGTDFTSRVTVGYDRAVIEGLLGIDFGHPWQPDGMRSLSMAIQDFITIDQISTYALNASDDFAIDFSAGFQILTERETRLQGYTRGYTSPGDVTVGGGGTITSLERREKVITGGYLGQAVFKYLDRYFVTVGFRRDGNSAFGQDFGWQTYPKVSASYVLSDEEFWPSSLGSIRLRGAWGQAGRAPGAFDATRTWNPIAYDGRTALDVGVPGNPELGPERSSEIELGFEGAALDERLSVNFTWYRKITDDALFEVEQAPSLTGGWPGRLENVGKFRNQGIELDVRVTPIRGRYTWEFGAQVATVKSEALELGGATEIEVTSRGKTIALGRPVPFYKGTIILNPNEVGPPQVVEDGFFGPTQPTLTVAPHMSLSLPLLPGGRSISLSARAEIRSGGWGFSEAIAWAVALGNTTVGSCFEAQRFIDAGQPDQLTGIEHVLCENGQYHDHLAGTFPTDFIKLREVAISAPVDFLIPGISSATLTVAGRNLFSDIRGFPYLDPEQQYSGGNLNFGPNMKPSAPKLITTSLRLSF